MADSAVPGSTQLRNNRMAKDDDISQNDLAQIPTQQLDDSVSGTTAGPPSAQQVEAWKWQYGPLARIQTTGERLPAFGGDFQPGRYKPPTSNFANPAPLGLSGFALTTFLLSLLNLGVRDIASPALIIGPAFAYGGFVQLLAGMWEFPQNNVFGATALSSYGGFWMSLGIILTPGGFNIQGSYANAHDFYEAFGLYIFGWFIYTFILWLCTLRSTVAFSLLFFTVWCTYLMLAISYIDNVDGVPNVKLQRAGGGFGIVAGFVAWWNMLAGIADRSNSLFLIPVLHFPWSDQGRAARGKTKDVEKEA